MKRSFVVNSISIFFVLLFLYTGVVKLLTINQFKEQMLASPVVGSWAGVIAWALPVGEILLVIPLIVPTWRQKGILLSGILMTAFTIYVGLILLIDKNLSCSCGGIVEQLSPKQHLVFNTACILLSLIGIIAMSRHRPTPRFRLLTTTGALFLFLLVGWSVFSAFSAPKTVKTGLEGRLLPSFDLLLPDSATNLNTNDIPTGKPLIFIGFSPTCIHCMEETKEIIAHIDQFKGTRIYFVTPFAFKDMKIYYEYFNLASYSNITMGHDDKDFFFPYFKAPGTPYNAIYDSKKRLSQAGVGPFKVSDLIKAVAE